MMESAGMGRRPSHAEEMLPLLKRHEGDVLHDDDLPDAIVDRSLERGRRLRLDGPSVGTKHLPSDELRTVG
jgi:hypothetical protein